MRTWRDVIIQKLENQQNRLLLVNDPDYLLNDEIILQRLREYQYEVVHFNDSILVRYLYESQWRDKIEQNEVKLLAFSNEEDRECFPFDFLRAGFHIRLKISDLFPKFSPSVIKYLDKEDFDALFFAHKQYQGSCSDRETLEYIVKHVYKIAYEFIDNKAELYKLLLSVHYEKKQLPTIVQQFLSDQLSGQSVFADIPVKHLLTSSAYFFQYIERQWAQFIEQLTELKEGSILEESPLYLAHPFSNSDVRRLMNDLFAEGYIRKVKITSSCSFPTWMKHGIEVDEEGVMSEKIRYLRDKIVAQLTSASRYKDWLTIMEWLGEYKCTVLDIGKGELESEVHTLFQEVNKKFEEWMLESYRSLTSLPPVPKPKMVHHIPQFLASKRGQNEKIALLVLDGMGYVQWRKMKHHLVSQGFSFEENGVFAWVPTLTSVSRQALFSGFMPSAFSQNLDTTAKEERYWKAFWENNGLLKQYVSYQKGLGKEVYKKEGIAAFKRPTIKVYGAVIDMIDQLIHGAVQGEKSLMLELQLWLDTGYLAQLLRDLHREKFTVYITSDHGNTESVGIGRVSEGVLVEQKGERVRIYNNPLLLNDALGKMSGISWSGVGLPEDYHALLAPYGQAFVNKNERIVSHGGISIEEVIVPFVKVIPRLGGS
ncbi:BREX-3 system phosphatase PglZ [Anoxybacillus rupiensis]|uniref:BREX-3 system phosphatase PglZ n=1 Tax=Anoxybacteroides rupiense TaxID=311460 RepID=A0ABT5VYV2_9BACL|nr:BREX-3 system phosphatase PglZ [Anoxybacillus rupiensis]MDE8562275.1 BREX-3 system phosphatase PglZ [Anoxybacillus rupiensis]